MAEVIALLIGRGTYTARSLDRSHQLLEAHGNCLGRLSAATPEEIMRVKGISERTAMNILAAMELGRRKRSASARERPFIANSHSAYDELRPVLADLPHEEFWLLLLDRGLRLIERRRLSVGGRHSTVADPKCIFHMALNKRSCSIVVAHNHPSGELAPSEGDIRLTRKLVEGGKVLDIAVQDHLIVTGMGYYSFADMGMM